MSTNRHITTSVKLEHGWKTVSATMHQGDRYVGECYGDYYTNCVCNLFLDIGEHYMKDVVLYSTELIRAVIERAKEEAILVNEYFYWDLIYPEWSMIIEQILPYNYYFTLDGTLITGEKAAEYCQIHRTTMWRGFAHSPQQPVPLYLPDNEHIATFFEDEMREYREFWDLNLSLTDISLLVCYLLGRPLTEDNKAYLLSPGGLIERFETFLS